MGHFVAVGEDVLRIDRDDCAAVVTHDLLHLPVHRAASVGVELGAGFSQQGVETLVLPVRIVPGRIGIPAPQLKHHGAVISLADIGHRLQKWLAGRLGVFAAMVVERGDDIIRPLTNSSSSFLISDIIYPPLSTTS